MPATIIFSPPNTFNPGDSLTLYYGLDQLLPSAGASGHRSVRLPLAATIVAARVTVSINTGLGGVLGTTEAVPVSIYNVGAAEATQIGDGAWDQAARTYVNTSMAVAIGASDGFLIRITTPAWVTNPELALIEVTVYVDDVVAVAAIAAQDSGISDNLASILTNDSDISGILAGDILTSQGLRYAGQLDAEEIASLRSPDINLQRSTHRSILKGRT